MRKATILTVLSLTGFGAARADLIATEPSASFGTFSQLNSGVIGSNALRENACVPTSVSNGLEFLENEYTVPNLMQPGYGTVNTLIADMGTVAPPPAGGTSYAGEVAGLQTYLGPGGQNAPVYIVGGQAVAPFGAPLDGGGTPSAMQMYNWLLADDAVEFWIGWTPPAGATCVYPNCGAHSVTLYGIDINTGANGAPTGTGTLSFIDPFGGTVNTAAAAAVPITTATFTTMGGLLFINGGYTGGAAGNGMDEDNTAASNMGFIVTDLAEAPASVPEPSSLLLLSLPVASALALLSKQRKQRVP